MTMQLSNSYIEEKSNMRAIEFTTEIKDGMIKIPEEYSKLTDQLARVIILTADEGKQISGYDKESIQNFLDKIQAKNTFGSISDPVEWQKSIRDEWEDS